MLARILDEAKNQADEILTHAQTDAENILNEYRRRAQANMEADYAKISLEVSRRMEQTGAMVQQMYRNTMLTAKSALLNEVFDRALMTLIYLPDEERLRIYTAILNRAIEKQVISEKNAVLDDPSEEYTVPLEYVLYLSSKDQLTIGKQLSESVSKTVKQFGKSLILSEQSAPIGGGFILSCGDVELCCTFEGYIEQIRAQIEGEICQILFA